MTSAPRRNPESGYALLFVYMLAACVAVMLYAQLPRVAFEAQRDKEQLLIDRGEQYERGIQLYFRKFHQYPPTLDALDKTQNIRFIRHRYVDPMTGKNDWRLIHVGAGGVLTDSVLNKGKSLAGSDKPPEKQTFVSEIGLVGTTNTADPNQPVNLATRRRASDTPGGPGAPGGPPATADPNNAAAVNAGTAGVVPPQQLQGANGGSIVLPDGRVIPAVNGVPGGTGQMQQGQPGQPGQQQTANSPYGMPAQQQAGNSPYGMPAQQQTANSPYGVPAQSNPYPQPSMPGQPGAPPTAAVNLINQLLTTPRAGGLNGMQGQGANPNSPYGGQQGVGQSVASQPGTQLGAQPGVQPGAMQGGIGQPGASPAGTGTNNTGTPITGTTGQTIGAGIAGVATKAEGEGIKLYNERSAYKEWEFIYDLSKDTSTGGRAAQGQVPQQQNGINGMNGANGSAGTGGGIGAGGIGGGGIGGTGIGAGGIGSGSSSSPFGSTVGGSPQQSSPAGQVGAPIPPPQPPPQ